MNRRGFLKGVLVATATVAVSIRLAHSYPSLDLNDGSWRYEQASKRYYYGLDKEKPWDVQIFYKRDLHDDESWEEVGVEGLHRHAGRAAMYAKHGSPYDLEEYEVASIIAMSQGMAAYRLQGHGSVAAFDGMQDMETSSPLPFISTTREELFRYG